ncbi:unnamed protein product [Euphydryas editha]|uniref:Uncharacterized protein n=1 Tax=Euphydryas editha TaxID=104508 RepID=A0AAU9V1L1_EUPED|nr:unnamed protein product [Euphydryas editha]
MYYGSQPPLTSAAKVPARRATHIGRHPTRWPGSTGGTSSCHHSSRTSHRFSRPWPARALRVAGSAARGGMKPARLSPRPAPVRPAPLRPHLYLISEPRDCRLLALGPCPTTAAGASSPDTTVS